MTREVTDRQQEVFGCIVKHILREGYPPTRRELCEMLGISGPNGVANSLKALERKGCIELSKNASRGIRVRFNDVDVMIEVFRSMTPKKRVEMFEALMDSFCFETGGKYLGRCSDG